MELEKVREPIQPLLGRLSLMRQIAISIIRPTNYYSEHVTNAQP